MAELGAPIIEPAALADVIAAAKEAVPGTPEHDAAVLVERAARAANAGRHDEARRDLAAALARTNDVRLLFLGFQFHFRAAVAEGETHEHRRAGLEEAERLVRRRLAVARTLGDSPHLGRAHTNLGLVLQYMGEARHAEAERHYREAIEIDRQSGFEEGLARDLGNLGNFLESTGAAARAEPFYREALAIARRIGVLRLVGSNLANLGDVALARGDHAAARRCWEEAAAILRSENIVKWLPEIERKLAALAQGEPR